MEKTDDKHRHSVLSLPCTAFSVLSMDLFPAPEAYPMDVPHCPGVSRAGQLGWASLWLPFASQHNNYN